MGLFHNDLFRSFAVGFALGAIGLVMVLGGGSEDGGNSVVPQAIAAPAEPAAGN